MKSRLSVVALLVVGVLLFASCLSSDDNDNDYQYYDDSAVAAFTLGTVNQYLHTTNSAGADSVYLSTYTGSDYKFYIDHANGKIYNPDSLPYGTDAAHLLATITAKNNGVVLLKDVVGDTYNYFVSSDSIDFTSPRVIRVVSQSGSYYRDYTVTVNVHKEEANGFNWTLTATEPQLAGLEKMKVVAVGSILYVFGYDGMQTQMFVSIDGGASWAPSNGIFGADVWKNVVVKRNELFMLDGSKLLKLSGTSWTDVATSVALQQLLGAGTTELYALGADGSLLVSADDGATWTTETLTDNAALLPLSDVSSIVQAVKTNDNMERVVLIGNNSAAANAVVWTKLVDHSATPAVCPWTYVEPSNSSYAAPKLSGLTAFPYGDELALFGVNNNAFSSFLSSLDSGIVWKSSTTLSYPSGFSSSTSSFTATVDADNYIWLVCGGSGQVWRGRLNRLGWTAK